MYFDFVIFVDKCAVIVCISEVADNTFSLLDWFEVTHKLRFSKHP